MRVISGKYKGRRFQPPKGFKSRPTTDFAKEALFGILENKCDISEAAVLDLFTGTGSIGLEFVSRGAKSVSSVDIQMVSCRFIQSIAEKLGIANWSVQKADAMSFCQKTSDTYDIIFADPPFDFKGTAGIPGLIFELNLLNDKGILVVEHDKRINFENTTHFEQLRKYGGVEFSFFISG